jgi:glycerol-3-phosphate dehydrogenase (NAD(P)+)
MSSVEVSKDRYRAAVLGAGSWGTALAIHLGSMGHEVALWGRDAALLDAMAERRANPTYLPDVTFPAPLRPTSCIATAVTEARHVVVAVPSHGLRAVLRKAAPELPREAILVSATKGIEPDSLKRMSEVLHDETGGRHPVVVLSGPSFAAEVARRLPTALVAASSDDAALKAVQEEFRGPLFRLYGSKDVVGVEINASMKNVIAIAAGVVEALGLGHNAMAALITRGLAEISRLSAAMGGERETASGLSGLGDLVLTCTGSFSRNRHVGLELGRGRTLDEIMAGMRMVAEGVRTTPAALELGRKYGVELPIAAQMAELFAGRKAPRDAVSDLMLRRQRGEQESGTV